MNARAYAPTGLLAAAAMTFAIASVEAYAQTSPRKLVVVMAQAHDPLYVDIASVDRRGSSVVFKYVLDVRAPADDGQTTGAWRSNEVDATIDCAKKTVSVRRLTGSPGPRATGKPTTVHAFSAADVKPERITPKSTFAYLEAHLCRAN
jgi:hypothetical protein